MNKCSLTSCIQIAYRLLLRRKAVLAVIIAVVAMAACDRRPLEVIVNNTVRVDVVARWRLVYVDLYGSVPTGMTVMVWGDDSRTPLVETTNEDRVTLRLKEGNYRVLVYNQMEREFLPYMRFYNQTSYDNIMARNTTYQSSTDGKTYTHYPDPIGVATDSFTISDQMVIQDTVIFMPYDDYISYGAGQEYVLEKVYEFPDTPWPMTVNVYLTCRVKHRQSVRGIEASLSGLADGFYLSRIVRTTEEATIEFDPKQWTFTAYGDDADSLGYITNSTPSFGLPYGKELLSQRDSTDNVLNLRIYLTNDSVMNLSYNVGKNIRYITPEGREAEIRYREDLHNLRLEIDLTDVINLPIIDNATGTGFDAIVVDWDDGGVIDVGGYARQKGPSARRASAPWSP